MDKELELLIKLHDLDMMIRDASEERFASEEEGLGFVFRNLESLREARASLRSKISEARLNHYDRLFARFGRAIAPVNNGVCYGCFLQLPTLFVQECRGNESVEVCPKCRRFLYWL
jgi:predicted  nucleic acid-binding Zn-ribbon protein